MSDLIPEELMANILLRLRVKDLVNCRRVSKQWLSIIDDPHFIRSQLECALSTNSNSALFVHDMESFSYSRVVYWKHKYADINSFFSTHPTRYEPTEKPVLIGSCHGLVCFALSNHPRADLRIMNPSTGECHTLKSNLNPSNEGDTLGRRAYGFGYDELSDDYKVVRILRTKRYDPDIKRSYTAEIYGVRSKGFFMTIPLPDANWANNYIGKSMGVFCRGSLHWCTRNSDTVEHVIHAIDLVSNTYRQLHLPGTTTFGQSWRMNLGIVDRRLCLCSYLRDEMKIGIWVTEEYWNFESWNMIYCLQYVEPCERNLWDATFVGSDGDKILMMINWRKLVWYDPTKNVNGSASATFGTDLRTLSLEALFCLESLVKIFSNDVKTHGCLQ
ncbi:F-box protein CPR1 [Linum grandiflorum]